MASADDAARLVEMLRTAGFQGHIFGGPAMGRTRFIRSCDGQAEGVLFPMLAEPSPLLVEFTDNFTETCQSRPDYAATLTFDAVRLTLQAFRKSGPNRAKLRDALAAQSPWQGISGVVRWDGLGANTRAVKMGLIQDGRVIPVPKPRDRDGSPIHSVPP
jgi:ABC-type branched-subunit amino acid transport system substrate-binding protein